MIAADGTGNREQDEEAAEQVANDSTHDNTSAIQSGHATAPFK
jgi:hypothetical protein